VGASHVGDVAGAMAPLVNSIMRPILYKYIIREIWPTFAASLFVSIFIIVSARMLSITEMVVNRGVLAGDVIRMILYLLPDMIGFALPASSLIAVVVAFLRLSADSEIIALKSSGVSLYQMLPPVVALSATWLILSLGISFIAVPWGNRSFKDLLFKIAQSKGDLGIKERVFSEPFDGVVFYVQSFSNRESVMRNVFVVDRRDKSVTSNIVAREGRILTFPRERVIKLHFLDGTMFIMDKKLSSSRSIKFTTYDLNIGLKDIMAALASRQKAPKEMSAGELIRSLASETKGEMKYNEMMIELMEKGAIPVAVFLMGVIGVPLGAQLRARGRSVGIGLSLVVFIFYYVCLAGMRSICETGVIPPALGVWIPDLFLLFISMYFIRRVANERPINPLKAISFRKKGILAHDASVAVLL
jgi:lipopolysaccharide export system permease protein